MTLTKRVIAAGLLGMAVVGQALALPTLSLVATPGKIHPRPEESFSVDLFLSGLKSANPSTLLGAFEVDLTYGPYFVDAQGFPSVLFQPSATRIGAALGDSQLGEVLVEQDEDDGKGHVHLAVVSLLESSEATCSFCVGPYLENLQQADTLLLATLRFNAFYPAANLGELRVRVIDSIFADGAGDVIQIEPVAEALVRVPVPTPLALTAALGIAWLAGTWRPRPQRAEPKE